MTQKGFGVIFVILSLVLITGSAVLFYTVLKENTSTAINQTIQRPVVPSIVPTPIPSSLPISSPSYSRNDYSIITEETLKQIMDSLNKSSYARVIVSIKGNEFTASSFNKDDEKKKQEVSKLQDQVLNNLKSEDITNVSRSKYIPSFAAEITKSGLQKLLNDPQVESINLDKLGLPM